MVGCTVITPEYAEIGLMAVERFKRHTGLDVVILWRQTREEAFIAKLEIPFTLAPQSICYFDSDLWVIRDCDLAQFNASPFFLAVKDPGVVDVADEKHKGSFPVLDAQLLGFDPSLYVNGGIWITDTRRPDHVAAFEIARQLYQEKLNGLWKDYKDYGEQGFLNAGIQRSGVPQQFLPQTWNYWTMAYQGGLVKSIPWGIIGLHAAGFGLQHKKEHLLTMEKALQCWGDEPRKGAFE